MAYFGRDASMPDWLRDPAFMESLQRIGITFSLRTREWHDYSDVDLVLAHRIASPTLLRENPASKLINAWHAGVPALPSDVAPDLLRSQTALSPLLRCPPCVARLIRQKLAAKAFRRKMAFEPRSLHNADHLGDVPEIGYREIKTSQWVPYRHIAA